MKKYLIIPFLSLVFSLGSAATASAQIKIGTVDMKKIFESYWRTKEAETKMSETRATVKRDLDERNDRRKVLQDSIEKLINIREKAGFLGPNARCQACGYLHEANITCDLDVSYPGKPVSNGQKISFTREELIELLSQAANVG